MTLAWKPMEGLETAGGLQEPSAKGTVSYASMALMVETTKEMLFAFGLLLASLAAVAVAARKAALGESGAGLRGGEIERWRRPGGVRSSGCTWKQAASVWPRRLHAVHETFWSDFGHRASV